MSNIERLTAQEESVMNIFWQHQVHTVKEVIELIPSPTPPYTTVASIVRNLEAKGYLQGTHRGRRYEYEILVSAQQYSESSVGRIVGQYFTGSYRDLVHHFAQQSMIDADDLREIINLIEQGKQTE